MNKKYIHEQLKHIVSHFMWWIDSKNLKYLKIVFLLILPNIFCNSIQLTSEQTAQIRQNKDVWQGYILESKINDLILELSNKYKPQTVVFENVNLLTMTENTIATKQTVVIKDGLISQVSNAGTASIPANALRIDATSKYLMPGLTDAHVHVGESNVEKLLNLTAGVTTVREMAGFTWMLDYREQVVANKILAPNLYIAGTMLNYFDLGIYAQVVRTPEEARQRVRAQKAAGFDFIKVWNRMPLELLEAIADESQKQGLDLVGHIPHKARIEHALSMGMKTLEHFKGYYLDNKLEMTDEDYIAVSQQHGNYWLSPTFAVYLNGLKDGAARKWLAESKAAQYIPGSIKEKWMVAANDSNFGKFGNIPARIFAMKREIFTKLVQNGQRNFIAGTDNNGANNFMIAGFALHEELSIMAELGLPRLDVLKAATINPARAMGRSHEYASIEVGKRADLILLDKNPLEDLEHLRSPRGVMVRGIWLSWEDMNSMLEAIIRINQAETEVAANPTRTLNQLLAYYKSEANKSILKPSSLQDFGLALAKIGKTDDAIDIMKITLGRYPSYDVYEALGNVYLSVSDTSQALQNYQKSIELYSYNQALRDKIKQLKTTDN